MDGANPAITLPMIPGLPLGARALSPLPVPSEAPPALLGKRQAVTSYRVVTKPLPAPPKEAPPRVMRSPQPLVPLATLQQVTARPTGVLPHQTLDLSHIKPLTADTKYTIYFNDRALLKEKIVHQTVAQKIGDAFYNTVVGLPKAVLRGLRGDADYSFGDFLQLGKIPYYLGGATLAAVFAAGRHGLTLARQGPAIVMYYLALGGTNTLINAWVKSQTGVDLDLKYRSPLGDLKPVFGDPTFSRYDLVPHETYEHMANKLRLPATMTDKDDEVQAIIAEMLPRVRLAKAVLGNTLAAVAAGYLARTDAWAEVFAPIPGMSWRQKPLRRVGLLARDTLRVIGRQLTGDHAARGMGLAVDRFKRVHAVAIGLLLAGLAATGQLLLTLAPKKRYEPANWQPSEQANPVYLTPMLNKARQVWQQDQQRERIWTSLDTVTGMNASPSPMTGGTP